MKLKKYSELIFGVCILTFGIFYFALTTRLPRKALIDATFVPYIVALFMIILGVLQVVIGVKESKKFDAKEYKSKSVDYLTVIRILSLIIIYVAFLEKIGFLICTIAFLFLAFILLSPPSKKLDKKTYAQYIIIAGIGSVVIYFAFKNGLDLMLPKGILG